MDTEMDVDNSTSEEKSSSTQSFLEPKVENSSPSPSPVSVVDVIVEASPRSNEKSNKICGTRETVKDDTSMTLPSDYPTTVDSEIIMKTVSNETNVEAMDDCKTNVENVAAVAEDSQKITNTSEKTGIDAKDSETVFAQDNEQKSPPSSEKKSLKESPTVRRNPPRNPKRLDCDPDMIYSSSFRDISSDSPSPKSRKKIMRRSYTPTSPKSKTSNSSPSTSSSTTTPEKVDEDSIWQKLDSSVLGIGRDSDDPDQYEVEKICHHRFLEKTHVSRGDRFLLRWKAWAHFHDEWKTVKQLTECKSDQIVEDYVEKLITNAREKEHQAVKSISPLHIDELWPPLIDNDVVCPCNSSSCQAFTTATVESYYSSYSKSSEELSDGWSVSPEKKTRGRPPKQRKIRPRNLQAEFESAHETNKPESGLQEENKNDWKDLADIEELCIDSERKKLLKPKYADVKRILSEIKEMYVCEETSGIVSFVETSDLEFKIQCPEAVIAWKAKKEAKK